MFTELVVRFELANMLDVAETILQSAPQREESRGAHQRTDFTARDDTRFLDHALAYRDSDGSACGRERSPKSRSQRWPPGERGVREAGHTWPTAFRCATRYTPGQDAEPTVAEYSVPLRKDWSVRRLELRQGPRRQQPLLSLVVPDGHLRQLRDERRGEPEDVCHLPHRLRPGPVRVER